MAELLQMGIPRHLAQVVASGQRPLSGVLEEMARNDKVDKLVAQHEIPRSFAVQCVLGQADLASYLSKRRCRSYLGTTRDRSVFSEALASGEPYSFALLTRSNRSLRVVGVDRYELTVEPADGGEAETIHKLTVKFLIQPAHRRALRKALSFDKALKQAQAEPIWRIQDRYSLADKAIFPWHEQGDRLQLTTVEGEQLQGTLAWFNRYELGLALKGGGLVTVMRHALADARRL